MGRDSARRMPRHARSDETGADSSSGATRRAGDDRSQADTDRLRVLLLLLPVAPVLIGQLPTLERIALAALEAAELLLLRDVQEELDQDHPLEHERALEADDLVVGALPLLLGGEALHSLDQH